jgi:cytochrome c biogenesis protein CcdA/glutaredoxin
VLSEKMKKLILLFFAISLSFVISAEFVFAQEKTVEVNFFYSATCPHCQNEKEFLQSLQKEYSWINLKQYEVVSNKENQKTLVEFYKKYNVPEQQWGTVPVTFTPSKYFIGFGPQTAEDLEICLKNCLEGGESELPQEINLPLFGQIDISNMSLPVLSVVLGALDGFNPCAMWILLFLLTLLINARSRKRMYLIGGTFVLASGIVYYLILNAWLRIFLVISYVNLTRTLIGIFALVVGIWQIRNFFTQKPGVCKVTGGDGFQEKIRTGLKNQAEKLVVSPLNLGIVMGVVILALGVNMVEFFCSAGLPAIFTRILALNHVSGINYQFYLLLYTFVFMLDDLIIFIVAAFTLSKIGFGQKYSHYTSLVGGILILIIGILLIFKPELLMFA